MYVNVDMDSGETFNTWIDSLQAAFTGVQVSERRMYLLGLIKFCMDIIIFASDIFG